MNRLFFLFAFQNCQILKLLRRINWAIAATKIHPKIYNRFWSILKIFYISDPMWLTAVIRSHGVRAYGVVHGIRSRLSYFLKAKGVLHSFSETFAVPRKLS